MTGSVLEKEARDRQACGRGGILLVENFPQGSENGKTRDKLGELAGCPVCEHPHRRGIEMLLLESPHPISRIAMFYELPEDALQYHRDTCKEAE